MNRRRRGLHPLQPAFRADLFGSAPRVPRGKLLGISAREFCLCSPNIAHFAAAINPRKTGAALPQRLVTVQE